jgi:Flp pilus assembly CpaE family ATPase
MLRRALFDHPANLALLVQEAESLAGLRLDPAAVRQILVLLRGMFPLSVLDLGASARSAAQEAMRLSEVILDVTGFDVPSLRLTRRYLLELEECGVPPGRVGLVANRLGQRNQVPWALAKEAVGRPFLTWLPDDPSRVNAARNRGQPSALVGWVSILGHRFRLLARHCLARSGATVGRKGKKS